MTFNVNDFTARFAQGGARPNLFEVQVTAPPALGSIPNFQFHCRAAQMPASSLGTIEVPYFGRKIKLAGDRTFAEWTVTIMNTEVMEIRQRLEQWSSLINSHVANERSSATSANFGYKAAASVTHFRKTGSANRTYQFVGLWPSEISPIDLDWSTTDTLEEYTVTWQYDYWTSAATDGFTAPGFSITI